MRFVLFFKLMFTVFATAILIGFSFIGDHSPTWAAIAAFTGVILIVGETSVFFMIQDKVDKD